MAKKKKDDGGSRRKSSNGGGQTKNLIALGAGALLGGIGGALVAGVGVDPKNAAIGLTVIGGVGAATMTGAARWGASGAAAAGVSSLAIGWLTKKTMEVEEAKLKADQATQTKVTGSFGPRTRQGLPPDVSQAFADAHARYEDEYAN